MRIKKDYVWLGLSIAGFTVLSISFLIMPLDIEVIPGAMFWGGLILGILFQILLADKKKKRSMRDKVRRVRVGMFSLFKNPVAIVFDLLMALSFIGLASSWILTKGLGHICYVFISLTVFSISMHCIFNGRIYLAITEQDGKKHGKARTLNNEGEEK